MTGSIGAITSGLRLRPVGPRATPLTVRSRTAAPTMSPSGHSRRFGFVRFRRHRGPEFFAMGQKATQSYLPQNAGEARSRDPVFARIIVSMNASKCPSAVV